jgi:hypothetical protein
MYVSTVTHSLLLRPVEFALEGTVVTPGLSHMPTCRSLTEEGPGM